jgi:MFS family permease
MALSATCSIVTTGTVFFIPLFLVDRFGISQASAAAIIAIVYFTGMWANPLAGYLSDRFGRVRLLITAALSTIPALYLLNIAPYAWGIVCLLVAFGIILALLQTSSETYIVNGVPPERCSSVLGVYYFASIAGGGVFASVLGALIDHRGFNFSFGLCAALVAAALLAYALWTWRQRQSPTKDAMRPA